MQLTGCHRQLESYSKTMTAPEIQSALKKLDVLKIENSFASLPPQFYTRLEPTPLPAPYLVCASESAAKLIGLDASEFQTAQFVETFTGNALLPDSMPLAAVYSGHQFGVWAGQLGDGRAILLGDTPAPNIEGPNVLELQLKGAGLTPYSRMGDGRAVLRSSIREFLCSEAMAALDIPSSRALCVTGSDQRVMRETVETAAVTTRMAPTFVRFGSFEHWYYNDKHEELKILADYVIARFYPQLREAGNPYQAMLTEVTRRTAELMAHWQAVGFMHGVMNTDNMSILGQTLDYGPFGFMEAFNPQHICNHTDQQGRYSYAMQPRIGNWNCYALGQALLPLIGEPDDVHVALQVYSSAYTEKMEALLHAKLGLQTRQAEDKTLFDDMFAIMQASHVDFTLFFRRLGNLRIDDQSSDEPLRDLFIDRAAFDAWAVQYRARLVQEGSRDDARRVAMHAVNPKYVLRNYLAQIAIDKAQSKDFSETEKLLRVLEHPFDEQPENEHYAALPPDWASELEVSCSS
jgi:serine/tyrosine/threonine adenylyltransferase